MLRVESSHDIYTEFEEEMILFDDDDPDFNHGIAGLPVPIIVRGKCGTNSLPEWPRHSHFFLGVQNCSAKMDSGCLAGD